MKLFLFIIPAFFASALFAQEDVSSVLSRYLQVIGGQANISRLKSIYSFADCMGPNGKYQTEIYSANGSRTIFRQIRENKPGYTGMVNGDTYWTKDSLETISNRKSAFVWRMHELQWMATHLAERFSDMKFSGYDMFSGKQAVKISATDELNQPAWLYFNKENHLLLGINIVNPFNENGEAIQMEITGWKKKKEYLFPSKVTFTDKQGSFVLDFQTIMTNQVNDSVFDIPRKISAVKRIMELHDLQRKAHFNRDAKLLVSVLADDYTEIRNGKIRMPGKADLIGRFQEYFDAVTFLEWDDIQPPVVNVSDDGTLAYTIVHKKVRLKTSDGKEELTTFAWTATYRRSNDDWRITSITSTIEE